MSFELDKQKEKTLKKLNIQSKVGADGSDDFLNSRLSNCRTF